MAGTGGGGGQRDSKPYVDTKSKTIWVSRGGGRNGGSSVEVPNPNYVPPPTVKKIDGLTPTYGQNTVSQGQNGSKQVDDLYNHQGYKKDLGNGFVEYYDTKGNLTRTLDQRPTGGGFVGGLGSFVGGTANTAASGVSNFADNLGTGLKTFAESDALPAALAVVAAAYSGGAFDPSSLASAGSAAGSAAGTAGTAAGTAGATTAPVYGGTVGGWTPLSTAGTTAAGTAGASSSGLLGGSGGTTASALTPAQIESAVGTSGYGTSAAADGLIGSGSSGGLTASALTPAQIESAVGTAGYGSSAAADAVVGAGVSGAGATGGAMTTIKDILNTAKDYAPLIGAVAGAAASGDTKTSTTADKSPWAPAQEWMKANLGLGPKLQAQYAANPFSQFQKQAYNNSAQLGNQFRSNLNGLIPQMNAFRPYQRTPQSQTVAPMQFAPANLGLTTNPFSGV